MRLASRAPSEWTRTHSLLLAVILSFGAIVRIGQYAARTSFWSDEAFIYLNVTQLDYDQLVGPLKFSQAAPPGFLWIERTLALAFGPGEYSLRLYPLLAGLAALFAFSLLARRLFPSPIALAVILLFALCDRLIAYCGEAKQYSSDVMFAVLTMLLLTDAVRNRVRRDDLFVSGPGIARLGLFVAVALWFSHTVIFVFAGAMLGLLPSQINRVSRLSLMSVAGCAVAAASLIALYMLSIRREHDQYLYTFWANGFPPHGGLPGKAAWLFHQGLEVVTLVQGNSGWLAVILVTAGAATLLEQARYVLLGCSLGTIAMVLSAACIGQYPFNGTRLTLFLVPSILLAIGAAFQDLRELDRPQWGILNVKYLWWLPVAFMSSVGLWQATHRLFAPRYHSHVRPAIEYVQAHRKTGEAIFFLGDPLPRSVLPAVGGRHYEYQCYWPDVPDPVHTTLQSVEEVPERRFWVVSPLPPDKGLSPIKPLLDRLKQSAREIDRLYVPQGGIAVLYAKQDRAATGPQAPASREGPPSR